MVETFTEADLEKANEEWQANCGPATLAFALQVPLEATRHAIPEFEAKGHTNITMMKKGIEFFGRKYFQDAQPPYKKSPVDVERMFTEDPSIIRIQFTGPWTDSGANPKWAYLYTHWMATWTERGVPLMYDCNAGIQGISGLEVLENLALTIPRADGDWSPTHAFRILN